MSSANFSSCTATAATIATTALTAAANAADATSTQQPSHTHTHSSSCRHSSSSTRGHLSSASIGMGEGVGSEEREINTDAAASSSMDAMQQSSTAITTHRRKRSGDEDRNERAAVAAAAVAATEEKTEAASTGKDACTPTGKRRKMQQGDSSSSSTVSVVAAAAAAATAGTAATTAATATTLLSLHTVERQIIMHYLDRHSTLYFARTCKRIYADAQCSTPADPHQYQQHLPIQCRDAAAVERCVRSPLLRHFPTHAIVDNEPALDGEHSFERLLSSALVRSNSVRYVKLEQASVSDAFISILTRNATTAANIHSFSLLPTVQTMMHLPEMMNDILVCLPALQRCSIGNNKAVSYTPLTRANALLTAICNTAPRLTHVGIKGVNALAKEGFGVTCLSVLETSAVEHLSLAPVDPTLLTAIAQSPLLTSRLRTLDLSLSTPMAAVAVGSDTLNSFRSFVQLTSLSLAVTDDRHLLHSHPFHRFLLALFPLLPALTSFRLHFAYLLSDESPVAHLRDVLLQLPLAVNLKHLSLGFGNGSWVISNGSLFCFLTPLTTQLIDVPAVALTLRSLQLCLSGDFSPIRITGMQQLRNSLLTLTQNMSTALPASLLDIGVVFEGSTASDQLTTLLAAPQYAQTAKRIRATHQSDEFWAYSN